MLYVLLYFIHKLSQRLKVKGPDIYIPPLTWKPKQQRFAV